MSDITYLYRHFDSSGALLYIGISCNPLRRTLEHEDSALWFNEVSFIKIEQFNSIEEASSSEKMAIRTEKPKYNKANTLRSKKVLKTLYLDESLSQRVEEAADKDGHSFNAYLIVLIKKALHGIPCAPSR